MGIHIERILFIIKKLQDNTQLSTKKLQEKVSEEFGDVSLRTIQRDLREMRKVDMNIIRIKEDNIVYYKYDNNFKYTGFEVVDNELLSFYILKAHLKSFRGTQIEDAVEELSEKLEGLAKGDVFDTKSLFWDKNIGYYDYTQFDPIIKRCIISIVRSEMVVIRYESHNLKKKNDIKVLIRTLFTYNGALYAAAYVPKHENHISLAIQNMESIELTNTKLLNAPKFDFDKFKYNRFGVFEGETKKIALEVKRDYKHFFKNRIWHKSQKMQEKSNGNLIIRLEVPVTYELIAWILWWTDAVKVIKPKELQETIIEKAKYILKKYE